VAGANHTSTWRATWTATRCRPSYLPTLATRGMSKIRPARAGEEKRRSAFVDSHFPGRGRSRRVATSSEAARRAIIISRSKAGIVGFCTRDLQAPQAHPATYGFHFWLMQEARAGAAWGRSDEPRGARRGLGLLCARVPSRNSKRAASRRWPSTGRLYTTLQGSRRLYVWKRYLQGERR
jgi:hypothetical protein